MDVLPRHLVEHAVCVYDAFPDIVRRRFFGSGWYQRYLDALVGLRSDPSQLMAAFRLAIDDGDAAFFTDLLRLTGGDFGQTRNTILDLSKPSSTSLFSYLRGHPALIALALRYPRLVAGSVNDFFAYNYEDQIQFGQANHPEAAISTSATVFIETYTQDDQLIQSILKPLIELLPTAPVWRYYLTHISPLTMTQLLRAISRHDLAFTGKTWAVAIQAWNRNYPDQPPLVQFPVYRARDPDITNLVLHAIDTNDEPSYQALLQGSDGHLDRPLRIFQRLVVDPTKTDWINQALVYPYLVVASMVDPTNPFFSTSTRRNDDGSTFLAVYTATDRLLTCLLLDTIRRDPSHLISIYHRYPQFFGRILEILQSRRVVLSSWVIDTITRAGWLESYPYIK